MLYYYQALWQVQMTGRNKGMGMEEKPMEDTGIKRIVLREIRELAEKHQAEKVILPGSRARGDYGRASDIDLAVYGGNILNRSRL